MSEYKSDLKLYKFIIPVPPESINETVALGTMYSDVRLIKRHWQKLTLQHLSSQKLDDPSLYPDEPFEKKVKATFNFYFKFKRRRDEDNYSLSAKGILDGLVEMGVLFADEQNFVTFGGINLLIDYDRPRCEVILEVTEENIESDPLNVEEALKMLDGLGEENDAHNPLKELD